MLKELIFHQSAGFFGSGAISEMLSNWEQLGIFDYILPFFLIFALVFGILIKTNIFKDNKMVNGIIALAVALMALQFNFVSEFFSEVFPRLGVGLIVILGLFIVVGLFFDENNKVINYILLGVGVIVFIVVLVNSAGATGWTSYYFWSEYWGWIIFGAIILIFVIAVINSKSNNQNNEKIPYVPIWGRGQSS